MIVAISHGEVLVEKRPPSGVWGGLWSLPEAPADADPAKWATGSLGLRVEGVEKLEPFTHAFTHFTLAVTPWLVRVKSSQKEASESLAMWLPLLEAATAALPAPVKSLLLRLRDATPRKRARSRRSG
jgi:A/G-specific adenine glycosylase